MTNTPLITVIIPTYRRPDLLKRAIQSVLDQSYPHFKICIYDNASGDETSRVVETLMKKDSRIFYHCHETNIGLVKNFQYGIQRVDTPYFCMPSDDDLLLPWFFEYALSFLEKHPDAAFFAGSSVIMNEKGNILDLTFTALQREGYYTNPEALQVMSQSDFPPWTSLLFRTMVQNHDQRHVDVEAGIAFDVDFLYRLAIAHPVVYSKKECAIFVRHDKACSAGSMDVKQTFRGWCHLIEKIPHYQSIPDDLKALIRTRLEDACRRYFFIIGLRLVIFKNYEGAIFLSHIFKDVFHNRKKHLLLYYAARFSESSKIVNWSLFLLYSIWKKIKQLQKRKMKKVEMEYKKYITL